nr:dsbD [Porphyrostromium japonicum]
MIYNFIDNYIFLFKEYCNYILTINTINININTFMGILAFGWLTSLNPCSISIIPIYLSYISNKNNSSKSRTNILFFSGFVANFMIICICIIYFAKLYKQTVANSILASGILLVFLGITLLRIVSLPTIFKNPLSQSSSEINVFTVGFSSGIVTSACNIPILITLLAWLTSLDNAMQSFLLGTTYLLGYSFSILFASILTSFLSEVNTFHKIISWCASIFGTIILSTGVFSICRFLRL